MAFGLAVKQAPILPQLEELDRLGSALGLGQDELGRLFGVSGESIRRWRNRQVAMPLDQRAKLGESAAALDRLEAIFQPQALAQAVRRKAAAFEGESALDWILRGRIRDVADIYEFVLSYQG